MTRVDNWRFARVLLAAVAIFATAGCSMLDVSDPTAVEEEELSNATGAELLRGDALGDFYRGYDRITQLTGLMSDELTVYSPSLTGNGVSWDRRAYPSEFMGYWSGVRRSATVAASKLEQAGLRAHAGEMLALRGLSAFILGANTCPGFVMAELDGFVAEVGSPLSTADAYERALPDFEKAIELAADSPRVQHFARVGHAAALLGLGRFSEAATAAQDVPTSYTWTAKYAVDTNVNQGNSLFFELFSFSSTLTSIAEREGGRGLNFVTAQDRRVQVVEYAQAASPIGSGEPVYRAGKYEGVASPTVIVSGIEARLIEAEASLGMGNAAWLGILNNLRATAVTPALPPLDDPVDEQARLDLLFRERAFWLFATGHRLGDLLRLIRLYDRDPNTVLPTGQYHQHDTEYGTTASIPFNTTEGGTPPSVTGCTGI